MSIRTIYTITIFIFPALFFVFLHTPVAHAAVIIQRSLYSGLTQGLVGHWTFDGPDIAGVTAFDKSGNNNRGILTNSPVQVSGKIGQALKFDGYNDRIDIADSSSLDGLTTNFTVSVWVKRTLLGNYGNIYRSGSQTNFWVVGFASNDKLYFSENGIADSIANTVLTDKTWHHIVVVKDGDSGTNIRFYVDGSADGGASVGTVATPSGTKEIGFINGAASSEFGGIIDDIRVYNRVLSLDEIKRLYKMGGTLTLNKSISNNSLTSGLVGHWTFDGPDVAGASSALTFYDRSGQGNRGISTSSPRLISGRIGQALSLNGSNQYVDISNESNFDFDRTSKLSFSAWVKTDNVLSASPNDDIFLCKEASFLGYCWYRLPTGEVGFVMRAALATDEIDVETTAGALTQGIWHHIAVTYNGSGLASGVTLYMDGTAMAMTTYTNNLVSSVVNNWDLRIGDWQGGAGGGELYHGSIDDLRVYNRVLSADEIKRLYKMGGTLTLNKTVTNSSLATGLVGHWTFDGPDISGVTASDRSGNNNRGILTNGPVRAPGKIGQALNFDGNNDYVTMGNVSAINGLTKITVSAWVRAVGVTSEKHFVDASACSGATDSGVFELLGGYGTARKAQFVIYKSGGSLDVYLSGAGTTNIDDGQWHFLLGRYDGSEVSIWVDGVWENAQEISGLTLSTTANSLEIGGNCNANFAGYSNAGIDDVRIYNRALSLDEIKRLYNMVR